MKANSSNANIQVISKSVEELMHNPESSSNDIYLDRIKNALNKEFSNHKCIAVLVSNKPTNKKQIFGARVYPTQNELVNINKEIVDLTSKNQYVLKEYIIELDYGLLYNTALDVSPDEMTAVIIHEMGHVVNFNQNIINIRNIILRGYAQIGVATASIVTGVLPLTTTVGLIIALHLFSSAVERDDMTKNEILADSLSVEYGYSNELKTVLTKIFDYTAGPKLKEDNVYKFIQLLIDPSRSRRLDELDRGLKKEQSNTNSSVLKGLIDFILKMPKNSKNSTVGINEQMELLFNESMQSFFEILSKGQSQLEIEELYVEIQRMTSYEDKTYIVARIGRDRKKAEEAIARLDPHDKASNSKIDSFIKELDNLSKLVRKSNPERQYGVLIKAPIGYEG